MKIQSKLTAIAIMGAMMAEYGYDTPLIMPRFKTIRGVRCEVRNSKENPKIGRNTPCNCGSGKKYKNCCIK